MKIQTLILGAVRCAVVGLLCITAACDTTVNTDVAEVGEPIEITDSIQATAFYKVDTAQSEVTWIGAKITGQHTGILVIQEGQLELHDSILVGGRIVLDMVATQSLDKNIDEESNKKLTTHLRSADFFDVERHKTAVFEITGIVPFDSTAQTADNTRKYSELRVKNPTHRLTGNLSIKSKKKSVTFPARITMAGDELRSKANFNIDRTQWGLTYRSDQSLGNQTIYPEVNINLNILAKPIPAEKAIE